MKPTLFSLAVILVSLLAHSAEPGFPGMTRNEFIYTEASFPECHASTICESGQSLLAAWFGGTREGHQDVGIWVARLKEGSWTKPAEVAVGIQEDGRRFPCWNPVLFQPSAGPLLLFYKVGPSPGKWWGMLMSSTDNGQTWTKPRRLPEGILGPIKNKPVQLPNGDLLCPSSSEHAGWRVHFERTSDLGLTWSATGPVNDGKEFGAIQPAILLHGGDRLQALGRTRQGSIFQIWSQDGGKTWGPMTATELPNPNSGIDAVTLANGKHVLVYNHTRKGRTPLNVAVSADGLGWQAAAVLEREPGEYSYPAVIQARDGQVHITYTWKRQRIKHIALDPNRLTLRPITGGNWPE